MTFAIHGLAVARGIAIGRAVLLAPPNQGSQIITDATGRHTNVSHGGAPITVVRTPLYGAYDGNSALFAFNNSVGNNLGWHELQGNLPDFTWYGNFDIDLYFLHENTDDDWMEVLGSHNTTTPGMQLEDFSNFWLAMNGGINGGTMRVYAGGSVIIEGPVNTYGRFGHINLKRVGSLITLSCDGVEVGSYSRNGVVGGGVFVFGGTETTHSLRACYLDLVNITKG